MKNLSEFYIWKHNLIKHLNSWLYEFKCIKDGGLYEMTMEWQPLVDYFSNSEGEFEVSIAVVNKLAQTILVYTQVYQGKYREI